MEKNAGLEKKTKFEYSVLRKPNFKTKKISQCRKLYTEAKRCFATHDEDNDYFNMRIYIILIACVYIQQFNFIQ